MARSSFWRQFRTPAARVALPSVSRAQLASALAHYESVAGDRRFRADVRDAARREAERLRGRLGVQK